MFGRGIHLFTVFGFSVRLDPSWFIVAVLATSNLATQVFPTQNPGLPRSTYWWMGVAGALLLFASVVVHELAHSLVARRYGVPMRGHHAVPLRRRGGDVGRGAPTPRPSSGSPSPARP